MFVTDEIALPVEGGEIVCDILALRRDGGRSTPVLLELKDDRLLTRLAEQVARASRKSRAIASVRAAASNVSGTNSSFKATMRCSRVSKAR